MSGQILPFNGTNDDAEPDATPEHIRQWNFLCFLGRIQDEDPSLEWLYSMAKGSSTAYKQLDPDTKDKLVMSEFLDQQYCLIPLFKEIALDCIVQETNPHRYKMDFSRYQHIIAHMGAEFGSGPLPPQA